MPSETAHLRQIMYQPSACWLSTENSGDRWLTDQFVLLDVTGHPALQWTNGFSDTEYADEWADGPYKLTASNGFQPRESVTEPDIEAWFTRVGQCAWHSAKPSEWSVAEHPGKAMLWVSGTQPCLLGESTWTALKRHHPECLVDYAADLNLFRFLDMPCTPEDCQWAEDVACGHRPVAFCYAAGIRVPDGQVEIAWSIAAGVVTTSNPVIDL